MRVQELLELVGLNPEHINRYRHQFIAHDLSGVRRISDRVAVMDLGKMRVAHRLVGHPLRSCVG